MKIKISKSQWEKIGNKAGWNKTNIKISQDVTNKEEHYLPAYKTIQETRKIIQHRTNQNNNHCHRCFDRRLVSRVKPH